MPIYTYQCDECGVRFDTRQKFSDDPIAECPECGGHTHRVPQAVGIVFRGKGWYVTDSQRRNNLATAPAKDDSAVKSDSGEAAAGDKTGEKSDTKASASDSVAPKSDSSAAKAVQDD